MTLKKEERCHSHRAVTRFWCQEPVYYTFYGKDDWSLEIWNGLKMHSESEGTAVFGGGGALAAKLWVSGTLRRTATKLPGSPFQQSPAKTFAT